ncbi:uncharacterized protein LOC125348759 isoform X1 [Perognathus longimembris pacificus]|uniref:uncharacterized protein LOC125348759 isoform X1 n=1 Tax=Perognathus longimembris pacificus TaxID=214514 RepID=UPI0020194FFB|nr:uncharacterized protein LOC125348759 isoform X1 [Perognathus longimembris pacificus]
MPSVPWGLRLFSTHRRRPPTPRARVAATRLTPNHIRGAFPSCPSSSPPWLGHDVPGAPGSPAPPGVVGLEEGICCPGSAPLLSPCVCLPWEGSLSPAGPLLQLPGHRGHHGCDMLLFLVLFFYEKNQCQSTDPSRAPAGRAQPAAPVPRLRGEGSPAQTGPRPTKGFTSQLNVQPTLSEDTPPPPPASAAASSAGWPLHRKWGPVAQRGGHCVPAGCRDLKDVLWKASFTLDLGLSIHTTHAPVPTTMMAFWSLLFWEETLQGPPFPTPSPPKRKVKQNKRGNMFQHRQFSSSAPSIPAPNLSEAGAWAGAALRALGASWGGRGHRLGPVLRKGCVAAQASPEVSCSAVLPLPL